MLSTACIVAISRQIADHHVLLASLPQAPILTQITSRGVTILLQPSKLILVLQTRVHEEDDCKAWDNAPHPDIQQDTPI